MLTEEKINDIKHIIIENLDQTETKKIPEKEIYNIYKYSPELSSAIMEEVLIPLESDGYIIQPHEVSSSARLTPLGSKIKHRGGWKKHIKELEAKSRMQKEREIKPDKHETYNNWGNNLGYLAKTKEGKEAEDLYKQAFDKYQKAIEIKPDLHETYNNWGNDLGNLAKTKEGKETEDLYKQAFDKYQKAIEIKPDKHETYNS